MDIKEWIEQNYLDAHFLPEFPQHIFEIKDVGLFLIIEPKEVEVEDQMESHLFDQQFNLLLSDFEVQLAEVVDYFTFCFGGNWYYFHKDKETKLNPLKYLGKFKSELI